MINTNGLRRVNNVGKRACGSHFSGTDKLT